MRMPAVALLSGGMDSAVVLAHAVRAGFDVHAISFDYGQRHKIELDLAKRLADTLGAASHRRIVLDKAAFQGSALTDDIDVPKHRSMDETIPVTYVPARNLVFLSLATAFAESLGAADIFLGVNAVDYSGYPDCRKAFIDSFQQTANLATRVGVSSEEPAIRVHTPLLELSKAEIVFMGEELGVDFSSTLSCYDPTVHDDGFRVCGACDACVLRAAGFAEAGVEDVRR